MDEASCTWVEYTPDCDDEAKNEHNLRLLLAARVKSLGYAKIRLNKLHAWCKCSTGTLRERAFWCTQLPPDSALRPDDPCGDEKNMQKRIEELEKEVAQLTSELIIAAKILENCINCSE